MKDLGAVSDPSDIANKSYVDGQFLIAAPPGGVQMFAGSTAPNGWLLCNGQAVSRTTYATLFGVIGTTYGSGDGSTTFNVPNMVDRTGIGVSGTKALASQGGTLDGNHTHSDTHTHSMSSHTHSFNDGGHTHSTPNHTHPLGVSGTARIMISGSAIVVDTANNTTAITPNFTATATGFTRSSGGSGTAASTSLNGTTESGGASTTGSGIANGTSGTPSTANTGNNSTSPSTGAPNSAGTNPGLPGYTALNYIIKT